MMFCEGFLFVRFVLGNKVNGKNDGKGKWNDKFCKGLALKQRIGRNQILLRCYD